MVFTEKTKGKSDRKQVKDVAAYSLAFMWPALPVASLKNTKLNWEGTSYPSGQKLASLQGKKKKGVLILWPKEEQKKIILVKINK